MLQHPERLRVKTRHPKNFRAYLMRQHGRLERIHREYLDTPGTAEYARHIDTILKQIEQLIDKLDVE